MTQTAQRPPSLIGSKIGNYAIESVLGEGGMGVVYLAEHPQIGKRVAIKVLHPDHAARSDAAARCFLEARAVNEIGHPNVVDIIDCGVAELEQGKVHYLLMELLEGESLRALLRRGALPVSRATKIAIEVGDALAAAHTKGIVHRDIKPENIFIGDEDQVKVLDFGIAKLLDGRAFGERLTQSGVTLGTPQYMAPEQLDNEDIDGRVDVYALGIVLFEMITGAAPFADETTARGVWRRMNELPTLTDAQREILPPGLEDLMMRTLDPDRIRRPEMADFVRGLADPSIELPALDGDPHTRRMPKLKTPAPGSIARPSTPTAETVDAGPSKSRFDQASESIELPQRRRWWLGLAALAGVTAIVIAIIAGTRGDTPRATTAPVKDPPAAAVVVVKIKTTPPGAEIYVGTEQAPRGVTPLEIRLPKASGAVAIRIARDGFADIRRSVDTLGDGALEEQLIGISRPSPPVMVRPPVRPVVRTMPDAGVHVPADAGTAAVPDAASARRTDGGLPSNLITP